MRAEAQVTPHTEMWVVTTEIGPTAYHGWRYAWHEFFSSVMRDQCISVFHPTVGLCVFDPQCYSTRKPTFTFFPNTSTLFAEPTP